MAWRALAEQGWQIARLYYEGPEKRVAWFNLGLNLLFQALMSLLFVVVSYTQARGATACVPLSSLLRPSVSQRA